MIRKVYATDRERKSDQRLGCVAFPLVNVPLWLIGLLISESVPHTTFQAIVLLLTWIVNGLILIAAFLFRPQIGVGYIMSVALIICGTLMMSALTVGSCLAGLAVALPLEAAEGPTTGIPAGHVLGYLVGLTLFFGGLTLLYRWARAAYRSWWS